MKKSISAALLATAALLPASAYAATVSHSLSYEKNNVGLDGGKALSFDKFTSTNVGIGRLRYGAEASGGDVDAEGDITFSTTFADTVRLADASAVKFSLTKDSLSFGYDAFTGAEAGVFIDFNSFLTFNPPELRIIGDDYRLDNEDSRNDGEFGSTGDERDTARLTGIGPNASLGLAVRAEATLDASQTTSFEVTDFTGILLAEHESGETSLASFSLKDDPMKFLDLKRAGKWDISLLDLALLNSFDSSTGISVGYEVGVAVEAPFFAGSCGDFSKDSDNEFGCGGDTGKSGDAPQLTLINPAAFAIDWGTFDKRDIGHVTVLAAVPLPAGLPMLLAGLAGFGLLRRKSRQSAA